jgi:hypothetical protein
MKGTPSRLKSFRTCERCPLYETCQDSGKLFNHDIDSAVTELRRSSYYAADSEGTPLEVTQNDALIVARKHDVEEYAKEIMGCVAIRVSGECITGKAEQVTVSEAYL